MEVIMSKSIKKGGIFTIQTDTNVAAWEDRYMSIDKSGITLTEWHIITWG